MLALLPFLCGACGCPNNDLVICRWTRMWQYFGTLICELFLEIIRSNVNKFNLIVIMLTILEC